MFDTGFCMEFYGEGLVMNRWFNITYIGWLVAGDHLFMNSKYVLF